jgi:hypothetical protein
MRLLNAVSASNNSRISSSTGNGSHSRLVLAGVRDLSSQQEKRNNTHYDRTRKIVDEENEEEWNVRESPSDPSPRDEQLHEKKQETDA